MEDDRQPIDSDGSARSADRERAWKEVSGESDRAAALILHARLEKFLRKSINDVFLQHGEQALRLLGDDDNPGVLGYSDQSRLAYCLGLVTDSEYKDLKHLGRIRNRFAHRGDYQSFSHKAIKELCDKLKLAESYDLLDDDSPRTNYTWTGAALISSINTAALKYALIKIKQFKGGGGAIRTSLGQQESRRRSRRPIGPLVAGRPRLPALH